MGVRISPQLLNYKNSKKRMKLIEEFMWATDSLNKKYAQVVSTLFTN